MSESYVTVDYSKRFLKQLKKAPLAIKIAFRERRALFREDSSHPQLSNHPLSGKLKGHRSINITGDWRALYSEEIDDEGNKVLIFEALGTHSQLYR